MKNKKATIIGEIKGHDLGVRTVVKVSKSGGVILSQPQMDDPQRVILSADEACELIALLQQAVMVLDAQ